MSQERINNATRLLKVPSSGDELGEVRTVALALCKNFKKARLYGGRR